MDQATTDSGTRLREETYAEYLQASRFESEYRPRFRLRSSNAEQAVLTREVGGSSPPEGTVIEV